MPFPTLKRSRPSRKARRGSPAHCRGSWPWSRTIPTSRRTRTSWRCRHSSRAPKTASRSRGATTSRRCASTTPRSGPCPRCCGRSSGSPTPNRSPPLPWPRTRWRCRRWISATAADEAGLVSARRSLSGPPSRATSAIETETGSGPKARLFARRAGAWGGHSTAAVLSLLLLVFGVSALAQSMPALTGRVVDSAGIIDAETEAALTARLEAFEQKSSDQIVVATIESLGGEAIEPYANRLFREWRLGQAGENNGVLLLVALADRRMRIEVGYGLEGTLTDLHAKLIIENTMVPAFRAGDFSGGIAQAVDDIIMVLEGNAAELEA